MKSLKTSTTAAVALLTCIVTMVRADDVLHSTGLGGLSRLSMRSLVATMTFMAFGIATVFVARHLG